MRRTHLGGPVPRVIHGTEWTTSGGLEHVCIEAVQSRGRGPGIHIFTLVFSLSLSLSLLLLIVVYQNPGSQSRLVLPLLTTVRALLSSREKASSLIFLRRLASNYTSPRYDGALSR